MRRIDEPMFRYGDEDFDRDYLAWGLHDNTTQNQEADSILSIADNRSGLRILDLGCGIGVHAVRFAEQGHHVTAVDLSDTFISKGKGLAERNGVEVMFVTGDIRYLPYRECFDLVTWIEKSFFNQQMAEAVHRYLCDGGLFIFDSRNPDNPKTQRLNSNWRTWREENGVYYLESHETDDASGLRRNLWVEIDTVRDVLRERLEEAEIDSRDRLEVLTAVGYRDAHYRCMNGSCFEGGTEPYWLWAVGAK